MKRISKKYLSSAAAVAATLLLPLSGFGQTVIGSWQDTDGDGWIDWGAPQPSITTLPGKYSFQSGAVSGYGQSLKITQAGWNQGLAIKLQNNGYVDDFLNNHLLSFTFSVPDAASAGSPASGYTQLYGFTLNASGFGYNDIAWSNPSWTGNSGAMPDFGWWSTAPARSITMTLDYTSLLPSITATPSSGYLELMFTSNTGGGAPAYFYMNDVVLHGGPVPEPSSLALVGLGTAGLLLARRRRN